MRRWQRRCMLVMLVSGSLSDTLAQTAPDLTTAASATPAEGRAQGAGMAPVTPVTRVAPVAPVAPAPTVAEPVVADLLAAPVLTDELIRAAVRATVAEDPHPLETAARNAAAYGAATVTARDRMTQAFNQGKVPDCLHDDALKLQPAFIGPFAVVGPLSLPWLVAAALRGKCR